MTSPLPNFPAVPAALPAATPSLSAAITELLPSIAPTSGPLPAAVLEFAALIPSPSAAGGRATGEGKPGASFAGVVRLATAPLAADAAPATTPPSLFAVPTPTGVPAAPSVAEAVAPLDVAAPAAEPIAAPVATTPTREQVEEAMALVLPLLQTLLPEAVALNVTAVPAAIQSSEAPAAGRPIFWAGSPPPAEAAAQSGEGAPSPAWQFAEADAPLPLADAPESAAANASAHRAVQPVHVVEATVVTDGAIELRIALPGFHAATQPPAANPRAVDRLPDTVASANPITSPDSNTRPGASEPVSILSGELQLGETPVRFEVSLGSRPAAPAAAENLERARANFAALSDGRIPTAEPVSPGAERTFLITGAKQVKLRSPEAGIAVAQNDGMLAAPTEEVRPTRNPEISALPTRSDFQVAPMPAERITVPAMVPAGQNFAERAVETVTNLVEAQFSASMQKSGSVQLRLKFGAEDLSVRVALRDGAVHTDFHTDSAELRAALTREWHAAVAEAPAQMQRFLEPVFAAAPASASNSSDPHQSPARQQSPASHQDFSQHQQRAGRDHAADSHSPFARRSLVSESFVPEPAAARVPAFLPTSLRLSALA